MFPSAKPSYVHYILYCIYYTSVLHMHNISVILFYLYVIMGRTGIILVLLDNKAISLLFSFWNIIERSMITRKIIIIIITFRNFITFCHSVPNVGNPLYSFLFSFAVYAYIFLSFRFLSLIFSLVSKSFHPFHYFPAYVLF